MGPPDRSGPGPLPAIVGGVLGAVVLVWLVGIVVGAIVFAVRILVLATIVVGGLWGWGKLTRD